jgi:cell division inhibitor SepF
MAESIFSKLKGLVGISDFDDDDDDALEEAPRSHVERRPVDVRPALYSSSSSRAERRDVSDPKDKVISMNKALNAITSQFNLIVTEPKSFDECPKLVDSLKTRKPIIINLEKAEMDEARKIFDFLSGATYALNGNVQKIANKIFVFVPENVNVSGGQPHKGIGFGPEPTSPWR